MNSSKEYLKHLEQDNIIIQWLVERFDFELTASGINSDEGESFSEDDLNFLLELVKVYDKPDDFDPKNFLNTSISLILMYLRRTHAFYLDQKLNEIEVLLDHWVNTESKVSVHLFKGFFSAYRAKLQHHIDQEESILFPYVDTLLLLQSGVKINWNKLFQTKISLIQFLLEHDHKIEEDLAIFAGLLVKYENEFSDNLAFRTLLPQIQAFKTDLSIHAAIEEQVLIPCANILEKSVLIDLSTEA